MFMVPRALCLELLRYINGRNSSDVLVYVTSNDNMVLLPRYDDATVNGAAEEPPPPYVSA
ncbi:Lysosomal-associated transmembrane protein 4B [Saguinus oedipus]|uniref:Lysosomal-associated transmembrane protein 4B n=1 Tax=Saguinus oedipus TaxID=9490 RepID=A0ABQ9WFD8_SAGOE|nr:Lysosomal-associated transmembrane protein 4B [Saguinus oedipus]